MTQRAYHGLNKVLVGMVREELFKPVYIDRRDYFEELGVTRECRVHNGVLAHVLGYVWDRRVSQGHVRERLEGRGTVVPYEGPQELRTRDVFMSIAAQS